MPDHEGGFDQAANLLGAVALLVADRMSDEVTASGGGESAAVALSALRHFLDAPTVDRLRQVLGLTSSGTVRLVDKLVAAGYVRRGTAEDRRATTVTLTETGVAAADAVTAARASVLVSALATLSPHERAEFGKLTGKLLAGQVRGPGATRWMCRLCDIGVCRGARGGCPVTNTAQARSAPPSPPPS